MLLTRYYHWLHGKWPAGLVEKMPHLNDDNSTTMPGVYVVGDLTGVPLLKFSSHTGAKAVKTIINDAAFKQRKHQEDIKDLIIIGGGVSGYAAAIEAQQTGLNFTLIEASQAFSTIHNFPKNKPIYTYPSDFTPDGELTFEEDVSVKERLLQHLQDKANQANIHPMIGHALCVKKTSNALRIDLDQADALYAHRVIVAIGRSGNYRQLEANGADSDKVTNRIHDPKIYANQNVLIVGGGDSALEAAIACQKADAHVTVSYRKAHFSRPKRDNVDQLNALQRDGKIDCIMSSHVTDISPNSVTLKQDNGETQTIDNDAVLTMIGREAPLDFFRKSLIGITGESSATGWLAFFTFMLFCVALYDWKNFGFLNSLWSQTSFPDAMPNWLASINAWWKSAVNDRTTLIGVIATSMKSRSFYYTLLYTSAIGYFGWLRVKRRQTPYVKRQTITLFLVQLFPLFLLPEVVLPWMGYLGAYDAGFGKTIADHLFPSYISITDLAAHNWPDWGHPRAYWHAYGFILAWPLSVWNVFSSNPMTGDPLYAWLVIAVIQTFILIPWAVRKWGKGAYCGWVCSCGALAETMGDTQRHKMPHGPAWNKLNMLGQVILLVAFVMLFIRIGAWIWPESWMNQHFALLLEGKNSSGATVNPLSWKWTVDILLGGILGVGLYFKFSGRTWCRFACPLAALMHIYARFSRFRIFANKDKCISCNACTSVCHQGIDVMRFANRGQPMEDPQCVRCSACVQTCPTGVLSFGQLNSKQGQPKLDTLAASPVLMAERIEIKNVS